MPSDRKGCNDYIAATSLATPSLPPQPTQSVVAQRTRLSAERTDAAQKKINLQLAPDVAYRAIRGL
jgi:hypothetical protein